MFRRVRPHCKIQFAILASFATGFAAKITSTFRALYDPVKFLAAALAIITVVIPSCRRHDAAIYVVVCRGESIRYDVVALVRGEEFRPDESGVFTFPASLAGVVVMLKVVVGGQVMIVGQFVLPPPAQSISKIQTA